jgi:chromosome segregation ATPase
MVAGTSGSGKKPFPKIRIIVTGKNRRSHLVLTPAAQMAVASGLFFGTLLLSYLALGQVSDPGRIAREERTVVRTEIANANLQDAVARLEDKFAKTSGARAAVEHQLFAIKGQAGMLSDQLAAAEAKLRAARDQQRSQPSHSGQFSAHPDPVVQLKEALARAQLDLRALAAESATLAARLNKAQADRSEQTALYEQYKASLAQAQHEVKQLSNGR